MTILPQAVLLYCITIVHASLPILNGTSIPTFDISDCPSSSDTRTLWGIIWTCGMTLFAWTWTAIHPNIPGTEEKKSTVLLRRLSLMTRALFVPELIITWATLQLFSARQTANDFNGIFKTQPEPDRPHGNLQNTEESAGTLCGEIPQPEESTVTLCGENPQPDERNRLAAPKPVNRGELDAGTFG